MKLPSKTALHGKTHRKLHYTDTLELHSRINTHISLKYKERIDLLSTLVTSECRNGLILDVGCAQGNLAILLSEMGRDVVAIDLRFEALTYAKMKQDQKRVHFVCATGDTLPFRNKMFEGVILGEILEHVAFPEDFLGETRRVLTPAGISTPNAECLSHDLPTYSNVGDRRKFSELQFSPGPEGHLFFFTAEELRQLLTRLLFKVQYANYFNSLLVNKYLELLLRRIPIHTIIALSRKLARITVFNRKTFREIVIVASYS
jgi:ubiquinone/menaquinone biosynthesis C-methylase UbiE